MNNPELLKYIEDQLNQGVSKEEIKRNLLANGWGESDVDEALAAMDGIKNQYSRAHNLLGAFGLFKRSWNLYKSRLGYFTKLALLPAILLSVTNGDAVQRALKISSATNVFESPSIFGTLVFLLIFLIVYSWTMILLLQGIKASEQQWTLGKVVKTSLVSLPLFLWTLILTLLTILGGYILLIIPGIILSISSGLAGVVFVAEGKKGTAAIGRSRELVKGKWWGVFARSAFISILSSIFYFLLLILFSLLRLPEKLMFVTLISSLLVLPLTFIYLYQLFTELQRVKGTTLTAESKGRSSTIILPIIGLLAGVALMIYFASFFGKLGTRSSDLLKEVRSLQPTDLSQCSNPHPVLGRDGCYQRVAEYKLDPNICGQIQDQDRLANCYSNVAGNLGQAELCENIPKENFWHNHCYVVVAEHEKDNTVCDSITEEQSRWSCYDAVAAAKGDPESCFALPQGASPDFCLGKVAKKLKDPSVCGRIINSQFRDFCYADVAYELRDKSICDQYISDSETKQRCINNLEQK